MKRNVSMLLLLTMLITFLSQPIIVTATETSTEFGESIENTEKEEMDIADENEEFTTNEIDETKSFKGESEIIINNEYENSVGEKKSEEEILGSDELVPNNGSVQKDEKTVIVEETSNASNQLLAAGDSISSATSISLGSTYSGSITSSNTADFYKFTLDSSGEIALTSAALIPWVSYGIYNSSGECLWGNTYSANSSGQSSISIAFDLTKGTYYFGVEKYYGNIGNYSFKIAFASAGESFTETGSGTDNTIATANSISTGTSYKGQIAKNDDKDFYKFTLSSSGKIALTATALISTVWYSIYNSSGECLWSNTYSANSSGQSSISIAFDLTKGTYYLGVEKYYGRTGNYSFKIAFASAGESFTETGSGTNNTITTANSISTGISYKGQIAKNDDKDFYKFTLSSSGKITLTSTALIPRVYYRIYNSSGECLWSSSYWANSSGQSRISETFDLTKGTYYLGVEQYSGTGNYSFKIAPHTHSYSTNVTKATTYRNGTIHYECVCGATKQSTIYYPKTLSLSSTSYIYNGKVRKPTVTVKGSDRKVISSANYTVTYSSGRKNVGAYTVKVTFKGNYSGTMQKTFKIKPKGTSISKLTAKSKGFTAKVKKQATQVTGYQIQYSVSKNFTSKTTKTITKSSTTSATYKGLKANKKYYVRVRTYKTVSGAKYYSSWSSAKVIKTKK